MADIQRFTTDLAHVSKLPDSPGLPYQQLQAVFDQAPQEIQEWLNDVLIPQVNAIKAITGDTDKTMTRDGAPADAKQVGVLFGQQNTTIGGISTRLSKVEGTGGIKTDQLAESAVTTAKIADGNVTAAKLGSSAVESAKIAASAVTTVKIADANVTTAKIANSAVTADKIGSGAVTNAKLAANAVTSGKITDGNVTTAKIADSAVTPAKLSKPYFATQENMILKSGTHYGTTLPAAGTAGRLFFKKV